MSLKQRIWMACGLRTPENVSPATYVLETRDLCAKYGNVQALDHVSMHVVEGHVCALMGPNGSGKSTTIRAIFGLLSEFGGYIDYGDVYLKGMNITGARPDELARKNVSLVPEGRHVFANMSVRENLQLGAFTLRDKRRVHQREEMVLSMFPRLGERIHQLAGTLSTGEQQMLVLGRATMAEPHVLVADEPTVGLSPQFVDMVFEMIVQISASGTTVLLVEQKAFRALEVANYGYVFSMGRIVKSGTSECLRGDPELIHLYVGK